MININSKQETIIYGGAFNPPTRAHQAILQACIDYAELRGADVWLLPSGDRTDKTIESTKENRLQMVAALAHDVIKKNVEITVSTMELDREVPTETYDTVREFERTFPDRSFTWVFGSDSVATMPSWHGGEWMMDHLNMLIVERPGTPIVALGKNATRLSVNSSDISSTQVRARLAQKLAVDDLVSPSVLEYLAR